MKSRIQRGSLLFLTLVIGLMTCASCSKPPEYLAEQHFFMDTIIVITLYDKKDQSIMDGAVALCKEYENQLSRTIKTSDINRINEANGQPVTVGQAAIDCIKKGMYYGDLSGGLFDITIQPLSKLWNFSAENPTLPDAQALAEAATHVDAKRIRIDGNQVQLPPGSGIDLGGVAKGYITDRIVDYLRGQGVTRGIVDLGGNVYVIGTKANGKPWRVGIQKPFAQRGESLAMIEVSDRSVVSSGDYERMFEIDGKRYHHILNPKTGYPVENELDAVTIISKYSSDCDGMASTCFMLGYEKGLQLIESLPDTEALFLFKDGQIKGSSGIGTTIPIEYK